jgi:hypothetical protein
LLLGLVGVAGLEQLASALACATPAADVVDAHVVAELVGELVDRAQFAQRRQRNQIFHVLLLLSGVRVVLRRSFDARGLSPRVWDVRYRCAAAAVAARSGTRRGDNVERLPEHVLSAF